MESINPTLQTILDTTEALIKEKGCRQTTLQDIIRETGLSKGAIYHYVSGKDELFGLVLKSRVEQINAQFTQVVHQPQTRGLDDPLLLIAESMVRTSHHKDVTNLIFIYLLGQMDNPKVSEIVQEIYGFIVQTCTRWIDLGKLHGAIPTEIDSGATAEMLVMMMYGLRVRNTVAQQPGNYTAQDMASFMRRLLN